MSLRPLALASLALLLPACECSPPPPAGDAGRDAPLPPGDPGRILGIPETESVSIPGLDGEVQVVYTELGVPHVYASTEHDLRVVQGYLMGRDRYFQIDLIRRFGLAQLGELIGTPGWSIDVLSRSQGMREVADRLLSMLTPDQMAMHQAFADGINAYVRAARAGEERAPSEFDMLDGLLGASRGSDLLEELTVRDLMGFAAGVVWQFGFTTTDLDVTRASAGIEEHFAGDPFATERVNGVLVDLLQRMDPVHDTTSVECASPPCFGLDGTAGPSPFLPSFELRRGASIEASLGARLGHALGRGAFLRGGIGADFGSNAWAVGRGATADGAGILAGDGHLPLSIAPLFYQMGLDTVVFGDGTDPRRQMGLFFAGIVPMAVGTNGHVAWSQTYQEADAVDWYREVLVLDASGAPMATMFGDPATARPLTSFEESEDVRAVSVLMSEARTETWRRWVTFDGRHIVEVEGRVVMDGVTPGPGETIVNVSGTPVIPGDVDGDGDVTAISIDFLGYDVTNLLQMADDFGRSESVDDFLAATRRNVAYTQNLAVADEHGDTLYTAYSGYPCRDYLRPEGETTGWAEGGDPLRVLDGTRFGAFEIPLDAEGRPDETAAAGDPYRCLVPAAEWPEARSPERGFVLTANNDIAGTSLDGDVSNDAHYLGGTYAEGYRASSIHRRLTELAASDAATIETMAALQGDHVSRTAEDYLPALVAAVEAAREAAAIVGLRSEEQEQLAAIYEPDAAAIDAALTRLTDWLADGAVAQSGVVTFYDPDAEADADASVATMIWAETFRRIFDRILSDEDIDEVMAHDPRTLRANLLRRLIDGRGPGNPEMLASWSDITFESALFDVRGTAPVERSEECLVGALADAIDALSAAPTEEIPLGFGTTDMSAWRWGLRHQVRFESILVIFAGADVPEVALLAGGFSISTRRLPLADDIPDGDPREDLRWYPRPGDFFAVDAANAALTLDADYTYGNGPVMRMVVELREGSVRGQNILPGGQSGLTVSEHFDDQAGDWLANRTIPMRFSVDDVVMGAVSRQAFRP